MTNFAILSSSEYLQNYIIFPSGNQVICISSLYFYFPDIYDLSLYKVAKQVCIICTSIMNRWIMNCWIVYRELAQPQKASTANRIKYFLTKHFIKNYFSWLYTCL